MKCWLAAAAALIASPAAGAASATQNATAIGNNSTAASKKSNVTFAKTDDNTPYKHFVAHNSTHTCSADAHATPFNNQIRGVNLGGWMVLEPWITPSLFYQFLGGDEKSTAVDISSFCQVLGPKEGNKQLRRHWETWVTEDIIEELAQSGAVNSLRLPVGDWMYQPYEPYIGCTDGALEYVDKLLDWAYSRGLSVLIDIHGVRGSQNGFDNSGQTQGFEWTSILNTEPAGLVTFQHWPVRTAEWMGTFDKVTAEYTDIKYENIQHALDTIQAIVDRYSGHPAVLGLEPLNEPWQYTPIKQLKQFYWEGYLIVKRGAPYWKYVMHDSFRFDPNVWGGFMGGCPDRALDTHIYQAWEDPHSRIHFYANACSQKDAIMRMENAFGPVVVGEWSLATDNCAMWLNGFNDNLPGFPRLPCKYTRCTDPYMGTKQPGTPVDPGKPIQGPYGTGMSGPIFGLCPTGRDWLKESSGSIETGKDWTKAPPEAPRDLDDSDDVITNLAYKKINAFWGVGHGFYFWNFRTDLNHTHWSYLLALERGWIPKGNLADDKIAMACHKEDTGLFKCVAKRGQLDTNLKNGVKYALNMDGKNSSYVSALSKEDLLKEADQVFNECWTSHSAAGVTCDFGGVAQLIELNRTYTDDDRTDDDYYYPYKEEANPEISIMIIILMLTFGIIFGSLIGCYAAMRFNRQFREKVMENQTLRPITSSKGFRSSFAGIRDEYIQIPESHPHK